MMMHYRSRSQKAFLSMTLIVWIMMMAILIGASSESADEEIIFEAGETTFQPPPSLSPNDNDNVDGNANGTDIGSGLNAPGHSNSNPNAKVIVFSTSVELDGTDLGHLEINEGQEAVDAVYNFCKQRPLLHNNAGARDGLLNRACGSELVVCSRRTPVVYSVLVDNKNESDDQHQHQPVVGMFALLEHVEPIDAVYEFMMQHKDRIPTTFRPSLFQAVCNAVPCTRSVPGKFV
jgi:hypothetical protein